jgi:transcriptional regulator with PAS, ATPase and Fis domain
VIPIFIPPLRERREDITALALNILERFNRTMNSNKRLAPAVLDRLVYYNFPGNVRELTNIMERMIILSEGNEITLADLPGELYDLVPAPHDLVREGLSLKAAVQSLERGMISEALRYHKSLSLAARALGVHPTTLWRKMTRHGISGTIAEKQ